MSSAHVVVLASILLFPPILILGFSWVTLRGPQLKRRSMWMTYRQFGRLILVATVAGWWVTWDLRGHVESLLFWVAPLVSLGIFLVGCYAVDRTLLRQRWSAMELLWRAMWRLVSFVIPLLMIAAAFDTILDGRLWGTAWLLGAGAVAKIGTGFLRRAEGIKLNRLKSGELRNRALKMAAQMGTKLDRVYIVPAGKGHLTNAYGMSNAIGLTDNLGKYLTRSQVDYIIAHELAHVKQKHGRKQLLLVLAIFSCLTLILFGFSWHALFFRPIIQFAVVIGPLAAIYYLSRRFELDADGVAVDFTGEPETAVRALVNIHQIDEVPQQCNVLAEIFMTHPSLLRRIRAIADISQIPAKRLEDILKEASA